MKQILRLSALIAASLTLCAAAFGDTASAPKKATKAAPVLICPVTGERIASVKDAVGHSTYKGKTYYFCCGGCKPEFDADPARFVKPVSTKAVK